MFGVLVRHLLAERELLHVIMSESVFDPVLRQAGREINKARREAVAEALLAHRAEIGHPKPELAVNVAHSTIMAVIRIRMIYGPSSDLQGGYSDKLLFREVTKALTAYLKSGAE